jgi:NCS1 family nucleobase:cation symporter-1
VILRVVLLLLLLQGANLPSLTRALVACAWFGIQTWIGGISIHQMLVAVSGHSLGGELMPVLGITSPQLGCFLLFWVLQVG